MVRCRGFDPPVRTSVLKEGYTMDLVKALTEKYMKPELPEMNVGDTVRVTVRVKEGNRVRNQAFDGGGGAARPAVTAPRVCA